jgi:hypothetical protein
MFTPIPSHSRFDYSSGIWWKVRILKPTLCNFLPFLVPFLHVPKHRRYTKCDIMTAKSLNIRLSCFGQKPCFTPIQNVYSYWYSHVYVLTQLTRRQNVSKLSDNTRSHNHTCLNFIANVLVVIPRPPCVSKRAHKGRVTGHPWDYILEGGAHIFGSWVWNLLHVTLPTSRN